MNRGTRKPVVYDLYHIAEDSRIEAIGNAVMSGQQIALLLEGEKLEPGKITRYLRKLKERFPQVCVTKRVPGPVDNVETLTFGIAQS